MSSRRPPPNPAAGGFAASPGRGRTHPHRKPTRAASSLQSPDPSHFTVPPETPTPDAPSVQTLTGNSEANPQASGCLRRIHFVDKKGSLARHLVGRRWFTVFTTRRRGKYLPPLRKRCVRPCEPATRARRSAAMDPPPQRRKFELARMDIRRCLVHPPMDNRGGAIRNAAWEIDRFVRAILRPPLR